MFLDILMQNSHTLSLTFTVCMLMCSCLCNRYKKYKISATSAAPKRYRFIKKKKKKHFCELFIWGSDPEIGLWQKKRESDVYQSHDVLRRW